MSLTPVTRDSLLNLKAEKDEHNRLKELETIVKMIYSQVISQAERTNITTYQFPKLPDINKWHQYNNSTEPYEKYGPFIKANSDDIIGAIQSLFPDCSVKYKSFALGVDRKLYDVTDLDESPFFNSQQKRVCISVDWS